MAISRGELQHKLMDHYGTGVWYRHSINPSFLYTEGAQCFAQEAGAYWFLDVVATEIQPLQSREPFIVVTLKVTPEATAEIVADNGDDVEIWSKKIEFTDCPEGEWKFYLIDNIMLLPSEY